MADSRFFDEESIAEHFRQLADGQLAEVHYVTNALKGEVFFDLLIEGVRFRGLCTASGPSIERMWDASHTVSVQLGVASISELQGREPIRGRSLVEGQPWSICKYRHQPRISLDGLSQRGIDRLAVEFGMPINAFGRGRHIDEAQSFYASPAFQALLRWADLHPHMAARASNEGHYLRGWASVLLDPPSGGSGSAMVA